MEYIVLVGGQLQNKGAQAMTFTLVERLNEMHPDKKVALFASVINKRDKAEVNYLNFEVIHFSMYTKEKILGDKTKKYSKKTKSLKRKFRESIGYQQNKSKIQNILKDTYKIIDISGYALSSQRGYQASLSYLYNLMIAKKFKIPMILFPQSFGPFNYKSEDAELIIPLIEEFLPYAEKIYAREEDGLNHLKKFNFNNVERSFDSVLLGPSKMNGKTIFSDEYSLLETQIKQSSVALIPNVKVMDHGNQSELLKVYKALVELILDSGKNVYLVRHSYEDLEINNRIKSAFMEEDRVILLEDDLNCIRIDHMIAEFEFIVASRYHAIIHSYKNGVPAFVFGWAIKYQELLSAFDQSKYMFDVREDINIEKVLSNLKYLLTNYELEAKKIKNKMNSIENEKLFDV